MRSPYRIDPFLRTLAAVWKQTPDMRFGQLLMNLSRTNAGFADTWHWEDGEWYRRMNEYAEAAAPPSPVQAGEATEGDRTSNA